MSVEVSRIFLSSHPSSQRRPVLIPMPNYLRLTLIYSTHRRTPPVTFPILNTVAQSYLGGVAHFNAHLLYGPVITAS